MTPANPAADKVEPWWKQIKQITGSKGVDIIFDPVADGDFLHHEIRLLSPRGTLWSYGLLGTPGTIDLSPLIRRKDAAIREGLLNALVGTPAEPKAHQHILQNVAAGVYHLPIAKTQVSEAHEAIEIGTHIGKYVLKPSLSSDWRLWRQTNQ